MGRKAFASLLMLLVCALTLAAQPAPQPAQPQRAAYAARLANATDVRKRLGLSPEYDTNPRLENLKIAVLDYGFDGVDGVKPYLPEGTVVVEHYDPEFVRRFNLGDSEFRKGFAPLNRHGRTMAQIVWAVTGFNPRGPTFYLLNANGPTMLRRAVRYAIENKVDIILFSGDFEGGGNGDGRGPINRIVSQAAAADILWINAAGNYGGHVYNGPVRINADGYLRFRDDFDGTALRFRNRLDENTVTITLTWNDYGEEEDAGTNKDLDLYVEDWRGKRVAAGEKDQVTGAKVPGPNESRNPRERIVLTDLAANPNFNYRIRVRAKRINFTVDDRIRVLITSTKESYVDPGSGNQMEAVKFFDASGKGEIYPPADNPLVLTVGDSSNVSSRGPTLDQRVKPDVILEDSRAFFSDGEVTAGASNAAAYFAGIAAVLKAAQPGLRTRHLLRLAQQSTASTSSSARQPAARSTGTPAPSTSYGQPLRTGDYRFYPPPGYAPAPSWSTSKIVTIDPFGMRVLVQGPQYTISGGLRDRYISVYPTPRAARPREEVLPAPSKATPVVAAKSSAQGRVWRTPTRAQLAEVMRTVR